MADDIFCQNCGFPVSAYSGCSNCGTELPFAPVGTSTSKRCPSCRTPNRNSANYCYNCGYSFVKRVKRELVQPRGDSINEIIKNKIQSHLNRKEKMNTDIKINKNQTRIGLWGPHASGKTVYMVALYLASRMTGIEDDNWKISLEDVDDASRALFDGLADNLRKGIFPPPNPPEQKEPDIYNFVFYPNEKVDKKRIALRKDSEDKLATYWDSFTKFMTQDPEDEIKKETEFPGISVSFADVAGERYLHEEQDSKLWNHIAGCQGLICLIDPEDCYDQFVTTNRLGQILHQKIKKENPDALIDNRRYLPHYVSLCFSKIDKPEWKDYQRGNGKSALDLLDYLEQETGYSIRKILEVDFSPDRIKYNLISSIGEVDMDDSGKIKKIKPYNIFAPLNEWVNKN